MNQFDVKQEFLKFIKKKRRSLATSPTILYESQWLRIFVSVLNTISDSTNIEIEFMYKAEDCKENELVKLIQGLKTIHNLVHHGFRFSFLQDACVWIVSKEFDDIPSDIIFECIHELYLITTS